MKTPSCNLDVPLIAVTPSSRLYIMTEGTNRQRERRNLLPFAARKYMTATGNADERFPRNRVL